MRIGKGGGYVPGSQFPARSSKRIACPTCGAGVATRCYGKLRAYRSTPHPERVALAKETLSRSHLARRWDLQKKGAEK